MLFNTEKVRESCLGCMNGRWGYELCKLDAPHRDTWYLIDWWRPWTIILKGKNDISSLMEFNCASWRFWVCSSTCFIRHYRKQRYDMTLGYLWDGDHTFNLHLSFGDLVHPYDWVSLQELLFYDAPICKGKGIWCIGNEKQQIIKTCICRYLGLALRCMGYRGQLRSTVTTMAEELRYVGNGLGWDAYWIWLMVLEKHSYMEYLGWQLLRLRLRHPVSWTGYFIDSISKETRAQRHRLGIRSTLQ